MISMKHAFVLFATLGVMLTTMYSRAQIGSAPGVNWDPDPTALLFSYRDIWPELANQDPTPLISIFGDGRVLVHYPVYTPKAGEYELWLQPLELKNLLLSLLAKGVATFEPEAVQRLKSSEERQRREVAVGAGSPEVFMVVGDSTSVFELHLTGYQPAGSALISGEVHRTISWLGLGTDAKRYPKIEPIQQLRAAEIESRALLKRDNLRRIRR